MQKGKDDLDSRVIQRLLQVWGKSTPIDVFGDIYF